MLCHRAIQTTQERRVNQGQWNKDQGEYRIKIRGRRTRLPNSYDDVMRTDWKHRCWKRHRLNQYHVINM